MIFTLDEIKQRIIEPVTRYGISKVYIFGSYARGTATEDSDIDILIDTENSLITGLISLAGLYNELAKALDKKIDLVTADSIEQPTNKIGQLRFRENLKKERVIIYEAA